MATYEEWKRQRTNGDNAYRAWKAKSGKVKAASDSITSRVNTWLENNDNYIYNFNTRYSAGN